MSRRVKQRGISRRRFLKNGLRSGAAVSLGAHSLLAGCAAPVRRPPSVILVTIDTLRADHLGCYGYGRTTSPSIDAFAHGAQLFERCFSHAPVTGSSCASILSGFLPHETQVFENRPIPEGVPTIPDRLKQEGFATAAVVSNSMLQRKRGWARGFDVYDHVLTEREAVRQGPERVAQGTTDTALALLEQFRGRPLFLWVHYQDPHGPYTPPPGLIDQFRDPAVAPRPLSVNDTVSGQGGIPYYQKLEGLTDYHDYVARYDAEIRYLDEHFARLVAALEQDGYLDDGVFVLTADHGEGMGERDYFFAHGENLYSSLTHVPLIIKHGNRLRGRRFDFVQHLDVVPTIYGVLGLDVDARFRGRDLRQAETEPAIFAEMRSPVAADGVKFSLLRDGYQLIVNWTSGVHELFDLRNDARTMRDLAGDPGQALRLRSMARELDTLRQEDLLVLGEVNRPPQLSEEERRRIEALGYVE